MKSTASDPAYLSLDERSERAVLYVPIPFFPDQINDALSRFFEATSGRSRFYLLLLSLSRPQSVRTANAMAFDLFLALIPMLGVAGWGAGLLSDSAEESHAPALFALAPVELRGFILEQFDSLSASKLAPLGVLVGWWLSSSAFATMIGVFEEAFQCEPRNWLRRRWISLLFALAGMVGLGLAGAFGVVVAMAPSMVAAFVTLLNESGLFRSAILLGAYLSMSAFLALLFRYSIRRPWRRRRVWPGAFVASTIGSGASVALAFYVTNNARYHLFYGGLTIIVVVLLWLWLWSTAILIGAEINVALEDVGRRPPRGRLRVSD